jgi:hypothetical protein
MVVIAGWRLTDSKRVLGLDVGVLRPSLYVVRVGVNFCVCVWVYTAVYITSEAVLEIVGRKQILRCSWRTSIFMDLGLGAVEPVDIMESRSENHIYKRGCYYLSF